MQNIFTPEEEKLLKAVPVSASDLDFSEIEESLSKFWNYLIKGEKPSNQSRFNILLNDKFKSWHAFLVNHKKLAPDLVSTLEKDPLLIYYLTSIIRNETLQKFFDLVWSKDADPSSLVIPKPDIFSKLLINFKEFLENYYDSYQKDLFYDSWSSYYTNKIQLQYSRLADRFFNHLYEKYV